MTWEHTSSAPERRGCRLTGAGQVGLPAAVPQPAADSADNINPSYQLLTHFPISSRRTQTSATGRRRQMHSTCSASTSYNPGRASGPLPLNQGMACRAQQLALFARYCAHPLW